jgi:hypothetical protein
MRAGLIKLPVLIGQCAHHFILPVEGRMLRLRLGLRCGNRIGLFSVPNFKFAIFNNQFSIGKAYRL